jgi:acetyl-CoA synthetase
VIVDGQYNIGHICTKQQCDRGLAEKTALRWVAPSQEPVDYSFRDLDQESNRFANVLTTLGLGAGEVFFIFLPKCPPQFFSFLGALKQQVICGTLFPNFGDDALLDRLGDSRAGAVLTKSSFLKKIDRIRHRLPHLKYVLLVDIEEDLAPDVLSYPALMREASSVFSTPVTPPRTPSVLHYTSGSTGKPKGVLHAHQGLLMMNATSREVMGLTEGDIYWCTADQGWVTGTSYGIMGPWSLGATQIHYGGMYDAARWFDILQREKVTVWYSAPTALRMLMREDSGLYERYDLSSLRHVFSVGEPLNPEVIAWARAHLKKDIYDTWFQTETGAIMISNRPGLEIRPGSMGKVVSGIEAAILADDGDPLPDGVQGNLCLKSDWPSMFLTYLNNSQAYQMKFAGGFYFTGDTAVRDRGGYFWFKGRSDDVINTAGHLISPFEIESTLLEMEEVAESGVIGAPDETLFEKVVAFVSIHPNFTASKELEIKMRLHVSNRLSSIATPQELVFVDGVPKTKSGKIMRRVLKARYLGQDEGDLSTLEDES